MHEKQKARSTINSFRRKTHNDRHATNWHLSLKTFSIFVCKHDSKKMVITKFSLFLYTKELLTLEKDSNYLCRRCSHPRFHHLLNFHCHRMTYVQPPWLYHCELLLQASLYHFCHHQLKIFITVVSPVKIKRLGKWT